MIRSKLGVIFHFCIFLIWKLRLIFSRPQKEFILVTGADSSHYKSVLQLLRSHSLKLEKVSIVFYDLGLSHAEKIELLNLFKNVNYFKFEFQKFPHYFSLDKNSGAYAWKPVIIQEVSTKYELPIIWLDAGNVITGEFKFERQIMRKFGIFTTVTRGTVRDWTHVNTINMLEAKKIEKHRELNGACIGFDNKNTDAKRILDLWRECAMNEEIISPKGANKTNHRYDQAVLSILVHKYLRIRLTYFRKQILNWPTRYLSYIMHCDIN